jgi:hypothetical protein
MFYRMMNVFYQFCSEKRPVQFSNSSLQKQIKDIKTATLALSQKCLFVCTVCIVMSTFILMFFKGWLKVLLLDTNETETHIKVYLLELD